LLERFGLKKREIRHWIVHGGGKKVIDAIQYNLGLTAHDLRHTRSILKGYGNVSSASFLFSYQALLREEIARPGDWGIAIAMGPGVSIETCLMRW
jgi:alkylresorcinol/alkylpyrone synthase/polyketide synthase Type III